MSGTLILSANRTWMPPGWVYDEALERLAAQLDAADPPLAARLLEARLEVSQGYLELEEAGAGQVHILLVAAERTYNQLVLEGPEAIGDPGHYAVFLWALSELKALLRTDPRAEDVFQQRSGALAIRPEAVWEAPGWIYDLALEDLAASVRAVDVPLAVGLIAGRVSSDGEGKYNLEGLEAERFARLADAVERLGLRYGDGRVRDTDAPELLAELAEYVVKLSELFAGDERIR